jgi:hypothetical protein
MKNQFLLSKFPLRDTILWFIEMRAKHHKFMREFSYFKLQHCLRLSGHLALNKSSVLPRVNSIYFHRLQNNNKLTKLVLGF